MRHDAFISYSRKNKAFASQVEKALESYSPPKDIGLPERRIDVFRDEEDFTGTDYHTAVNEHLRESEKLIIICSPDARVSSFVDEEIRQFAMVNGSDNIIPILFQGIPNNEGTEDEHDEFAFPSALMEVMQLPLAIDYRDFDPGKHKVRKAEYESSWFTLLSNIYGVSRSQIEGRERKRQVRVRNIWLSGISATMAVLVAITIWALTERDNAREQRDAALRSQSTFLAQQSRQQTASGNPDLGMRLALEALPRSLDRPHRPWVRSAESALYGAFASQRFRFELGGRQAGFAESLSEARINPSGATAVLDYGVLAELWSLKSGVRINTFRSDDDNSYVRNVAFSPNGRFLTISYTTLGNLIFMGPGGPTVRGSVFETVDAESGEPVKIFQVPGHTENFVRYSPDSDLMLIATDEWFMLLDTLQWTQVGGDTIANLGNHFAPPYRHALFSIDQSKIAVATEAGFVGIIDLVARTVRDIYVTKEPIIGLLLLQRDGARVVVATASEVRAFDSSDPSKSEPVFAESEDRILAVAYSAERSAIYAVTNSGRVISHSSDGEKIEFVAEAASGKELQRAHFDSSSSAVIVEWDDGAVEYWDLEHRTTIRVHEGTADTRLTSADFALNDATVLLASADNFARIWDPSIVRPIQKRLSLEDKTALVVVPHPVDNRIAIGRQDGSIELRDADTGETVWTTPTAHGDEVRSLAFDSAGVRLVSTYADNSGAIWELHSENPPLALKGHTAPADFSAFSPSNDIVATGSSDSTFRLWDASSGVELHVLAIPERYLSDIHNASINPQAEFTSDGRFIVTVTAGDGYVVAQPALVWDTQTGQLLRALTGQMAIWDIAISQNDQFVVSTSYDNSAILWDLHSGERVQTFLGHTVTVIKAAIFDHDQLLATASPDGSLHIWSIDSGLLVHDLITGEGLLNLEVSNENQFLATGTANDDGWGVTIWDAYNGFPLATFSGKGSPLKPLEGLRFAHDDLSLLILTKAGDVNVWSLPPTGQALVDGSWKRVAVSPEELLSREQRIRFALEPD